MRLTTIIILFCFVSLMFLGQTFREKELVDDIYNLTSQLEWKYNYTVLENSDNPQDLTTHRFQNVLHKAVDFFGYSAFEGAKASIEYGYNHPEIDWEKVKDFIFLIFWLILIIALIRELPFIIGLIYVIIIAIWNLYKLIQKKIKSKRCDE